MYKHYKGGIYEFICCAAQESNNQPVVVYKSTINGDIWTRPLDEFFEKFKLITLVARDRECKGCGISINHMHPNAKFHSTKCKNYYWNYINPRGYGLIGDY